MIKKSNYDWSEKSIIKTELKEPSESSSFIGFWDLSEVKKRE